VFADAADRRDYLQCLADAAAANGVALHGYGLSAVEVRLLATPIDALALGKMFQAIGRRFVAGYNRRHHRHGGLWEGRFRSAVVEAQAHFMDALHFVEGAFGKEPADATGDDAPWSSTAHHAGLRNDAFVTAHPRFWALGNTPFDREVAYRASAERAAHAAWPDGTALAGGQGWALGSAAFVQQLGERMDRRLRPLAAGRPRRRPVDVT
jgi:putative transposase